MRIRPPWLPGLGVGILLFAGGLLWVEGQRRPPRPPAASPPSPAVARTAAPAVAAVAPPVRLPLYQRWRNFTSKDGLPSDHVFCVEIDGDRVWAGTDEGLALYQNGTWRAFTEKDGIPHRVVHAIDVSARTGDVWFATFRGLGHYSGGRFTSFTQFNSGLPNNVVYAVACVDDEVWAATTAGTGRYHPRTKTWSIFTEKNTPMHEIWCYQLGKGEDSSRVYIAVWGGGVLEYDRQADRWRDYRDPDGELEVDLMPNDGLIHDIATSVDTGGGYLWVSTYFGLSRYDFRRWQSYSEDDSGLPSDFINLVQARGPLVWVCTDKGLAVTDGEQWAVYRPAEDGRAEMLRYRGRELLERRAAPSSIAHRYVLGCDVGAGGREVWVATSAGLSHSVADSTW